jgi:hypothetical protein
MREGHQNLKTIRFEGEMLPNWAQLLDLAARLCPVTEDTRSWFSRFTNSSGVDDARTVVEEARILQRALRENKPQLITQLHRTQGGAQPSQIFAAWEYSLDTIILAASAKKTCSWIVEGLEEIGGGDYGDGDISLRRV